MVQSWFNHCLYVWINDEVSNAMKWQGRHVECAKHFWLCLLWKFTTLKSPHISFLSYLFSFLIQTPLCYLSSYDPQTKNELLLPDDMQGQTTKQNLNVSYSAVKKPRGYKPKNPDFMTALLTHRQADPNQSADCHDASWQSAVTKIIIHSRSNNNSLAKQNC